MKHQVALLNKTDNTPFSKFTKKLQCLKYKLLNDNDTVRLSKWKFIIQLHAADNQIVKLSPLTLKAVTKTYYMTKYGLVLKVFCEETVAALHVKFPEAEEIQHFSLKQISSGGLLSTVKQKV